MYGIRQNQNASFSNSHLTRTKPKENFLESIGKTFLNLFLIASEIATEAIVDILAPEAALVSNFGISTMYGAIYESMDFMGRVKRNPATLATDAVLNFGLPFLSFTTSIRRNTRFIDQTNNELKNIKIIEINENLSKLSKLKYSNPKEYQNLINLRKTYKAGSINIDAENYISKVFDYFEATKGKDLSFRKWLNSPLDRNNFSNYVKRNDIFKQQLSSMRIELVNKEGIEKYWLKNRTRVITDIQPINVNKYASFKRLNKNISEQFIANTKNRIADVVEDNAKLIENVSDRQLAINNFYKENNPSHLFDKDIPLDKLLSNIESKSFSLYKNMYVKAITSKHAFSKVIEQNTYSEQLLDQQKLFLNHLIESGMDQRLAKMLTYEVFLRKATDRLKGTELWLTQTNIQNKMNLIADVFKGIIKKDGWEKTTGPLFALRYNNLKRTLLISGSDTLMGENEIIWRSLRDMFDQSDLINIQKDLRFKFLNQKQNLITRLRKKGLTKSLARVSQFTRLTNPINLGRFPVSLAYRYLMKRIKNTIELGDTALKRGIRSMSNLSDKAFLKALTSHQLVRLDSSWIVGYRILGYDGYKYLISIFFNPKTTNNKVPVFRWASNADLIQFFKSPGEFYLSNRSNWAATRGGKSALDETINLNMLFNPMQTIKKTSLTSPGDLLRSKNKVPNFGLLMFLPVNELRYGLSIISNIKKTFSGKNLNDNFVSRAINSFEVSVASRSIRLVFRGLLGSTLNRIVNTHQSSKISQFFIKRIGTHYSAWAKHAIKLETQRIGTTFLVNGIKNKINGKSFDTSFMYNLKVNTARVLRDNTRSYVNINHKDLTGINVVQGKRKIAYMKRIPNAFNPYKRIKF